MTSLTIVFAGTPAFGLPCLDALYNSEHQLIGVFTQPDRPSGRGRQLQASAVKQWALTHRVPVYQPNNFKNEGAVAELASLRPDLLVVIAYGLILPRVVLETPRLGCVNVHASLLPRWRGASPIQQAILHGDTLSGVTIMQMDVGMDTGPILSQSECPLDATETATTLHDKLARLSPKPLVQVIAQLAQGQVHAVAQEVSAATYSKKILKEDGHINWYDPASCIERQVRAFNPWPIAYTHFGEAVLRVHKAVCSAVECKAPPGTILELNKQGILVATGDGALLLETIQFPSAKVVSVADWLHSGKTQLYEGLVFQ